ncbi:predicted protein [Histoplasma mississippiense (nom. inval.)]|uniref:predicted protein n=1 Tax=Ajellomyces capsulatus (strain NAm1 / WU24) TaxID=2059318 RepID=UPI000157C538|nr:predicted protein [Histoplasma mississippiense (nom. inval.)]EDN08534.1 predicted protein [Histoplasma mississippiense (nom. inval.)]
MGCDKNQPSLLYSRYTTSSGKAEKNRYFFRHPLCKERSERKYKAVMKLFDGEGGPIKKDGASEEVSGKGWEDVRREGW